MGTVSNDDRRFGISDEEVRSVERRIELGGSQQGVMEGSGTVNSWNESVDRMMDSSPQFTSAVRAAFSRFCLPSPDSAIPPEQLLSALQYLVQLIVENVDERAGKIFLRHVTQDDIDVISRNDGALAETEGQPINFRAFDLYSRHLLKRVALDRGKRLGLFVLGGLVAVHLTKSILRKIPFIGGLVHTLVPTLLAGPAVGAAGALYLGT